MSTKFVLGVKYIWKHACYRLWIQTSWGRIVAVPRLVFLSFTIDEIGTNIDVMTPRKQSSKANITVFAIDVK